jgi:hypothetical protein
MPVPAASGDVHKAREELWILDESGASPIVQSPVTESPVTAEIVAPAAPRSPLQFGLRTLLLLMAVCSVQFAIMSYLGVLAGMVTGTLACFALFSAVFLVGIALPARQVAHHIARLDRLVVLLMVGILVLFFGTMLAGGGVVVWQQISRVQREVWLERQLGCGLKPESLMVPNATGAQSQQVLRITSIKTGSPADLAGLREQEVLLLAGTVDQFYTNLERNRGSDVDVTVATAAGYFVNGGSERNVTLSVP